MKSTENLAWMWRAFCDGDMFVNALRVLKGTLCKRQTWLKGLNTRDPVY